MTNCDLNLKYNPEGSILRAHQLRMLEILKQVAGICDKFNLTYWLSDGTLLGAVRHGGFIPWDDDLDIQMPSNDFKKFVRIAQRELPNDLVLQTHSSDSAFVAPYAKVRDLNSEISEIGNIDQNYKYRGIYIDIFPVGNYSMTLNKVSTYLHVYFLYRPSHLKLNAFKKICLNFTYSSLSIIYFVFKQIDKCRQIDYYNYTYGSAFNVLYPKTCIFPLTTMSFEGLIFKVPNNPDIYLKRLYGNYMTLPPESKRETHTIKVILNK